MKKVKKKDILKLADHMGFDFEGKPEVNKHLLKAIADDVAAMKKKQFKNLDEWVFPILEAVGIIAGFVDEVPASKFTFPEEPVKVKKRKPAAEKARKRTSHTRGVGEFLAGWTLERDDFTLAEATKAVMQEFADRTDEKATMRTVRTMIGAHTHPSPWERRYGVSIKVLEGDAGNLKKSIEETRVFKAKRKDWA